MFSEHLVPLILHSTSVLYCLLNFDILIMNIIFVLLQHSFLNSIFLIVWTLIVG